MARHGRDGWERFLAYVRRAHAKPSFEQEERGYKLAVAGGLRESLGEARNGGPWFESMVEVLRAPFVEVGGYRYDLPNTPQMQWFRRWRESDPESLREAVSVFGDGADPQARFASFVAASDRGAQSGHVEPNPGAALALGSLFNFAVAPEQLPLVRSWPFDYVEHMLEWSTKSHGSLADQYSHHVRFADELRQRLLAEGLPLRDTIDVQSLIFIAAQDHDFWAVDPPDPAPAGSPDERAAGTPYLSICATYRDEAPYLREWIEFHRLVGVERFFLYDNGSKDDHRAVLAPYVEPGIVVIHDWPVFPGQVEAFDHCVIEHRNDSRWIAFVDVDEFLFSPTGRPLPELLAGYERWPGVGVNWALFGSSGHRSPPPGLAIEQYDSRSASTLSNRYIKSIVDPTRVAHAGNAHYFVFDHQTTVDENEYPIRGMLTKSVSFERLRINHYFARSEQEAREKLKGRGWHWDSLSRARQAEVDSGAFSEIVDEAIKPYVPAVRTALEKLERSGSPAQPAET
jgi:glycosyl transferase family 92